MQKVAHPIPVKTAFLAHYCLGWQGRPCCPINYTPVCNYYISMDYIVLCIINTILLAQVVTAVIIPITSTQSARALIYL